MIIAVPAMIGYYFGKKYTLFSVAPMVLIAQPDRQDPDQTQCRFLDTQGYCVVANKKGIFFPNICDNKWNQVTCSFYLRQMKFKKSTVSLQKGDIIDEIQ